ncbi:hypothetical protein M422DRAFT_266188 [Sphaerobolus stellatus SS14]|uniref:HNH nuclease domain-containing protein n=1 Tax=Sphaerobolus stellatus (strain SS14) TaxID=990650 RepID=A0A0C9TPS1_SPHS4|nr:hypothetical protein M422DRAFT_266188 [Sphaerobolus stellatus SS14]
MTNDSFAALSTISAELKRSAREASGDLATDTLISRAFCALAFFEKDDKRLLPHLSGLPAILECAPSEYGRRFIAAAIYSCGETDRLVDLSNAWVRYLLLPFKGNRSGFPPPSDLATSTYNAETAPSNGLDPLPSSRASNMTELVRLRDGYKCWATESYVYEHIPPGGVGAPLEVSHIIKRAVGVFNVQKDDGSLATWDIIRHYTDWDAKRTQEVGEQLDTPLNGMLIIMLLHPGWDDYAWTLKPVVGNNDQAIPNTYEVEVLTPDEFPDLVLRKSDGTLVNRRVTFEDHGVKPDVQALVAKDGKINIKHQRPLPDPDLIALHRAISRVLHLSGAGEIIDSAFRKAEAAGITVPSKKIRTTDELAMMLSCRAALRFF